MIKMFNQKDLKARIEEEEKLLQFYVRYRSQIIKMSSEHGWEIEVNECLDIIKEFYQMLKE